MDVLIVEDEAPLLASLCEGLEGFLPGTEIRGAGSVAEATEILAEIDPPKVVVSDLRLPGESGLDFLLELHQRFPHVGFILMSAYESPLRQDVDEHGLIRFLRKPFPIARLVEEVRSALQTATFRGQVHGISVVEVLQILDLGRKTAKLRVHHRSREGAIFVDDGRPVHATVGRATGKQAFREIVSWSGGGFALESGVRTTERTLDETMGGLLLEIAQEIDEINRGRQSGMVRDIAGALDGVSAGIGGKPVEVSPALVERLHAVCEDLVGEMPGALMARVFDPAGSASLGAAVTGGADPDVLEGLLAQATSLFTASIEPVEELRISTSSAHVFVVRVPEQTLLLCLATRRDTTIGMALAALRRTIVQILRATD